MHCADSIRRNAGPVEGRASNNHGLLLASRRGHARFRAPSPTIAALLFETPAGPPVQSGDRAKAYLVTAAQMVGIPVELLSLPAPAAIREPEALAAVDGGFFTHSTRLSSQLWPTSGTAPGNTCTAPLLLSCGCLLVARRPTLPRCRGSWPVRALGCTPIARAGRSSSLCPATSGPGNQAGSRVERPLVIRLHTG